MMRREIQDFNRDIGKHFDVKYSQTKEARREIRVRYHLSSDPSHLALSDLRTILFNYLFAKTADKQKEGQLILTVPTINEEIQASMKMIREKIGLTWEEGPDNIPKKCV
jgi:hypothetical protein